MCVCVFVDMCVQIHQQILIRIEDVADILSGYVLSTTFWIPPSDPTYVICLYVFRIFLHKLGARVISGFITVGGGVHGFVALFVQSHAMACCPSHGFKAALEFRNDLENQCYHLVPAAHLMQ